MRVSVKISPTYLDVYERRPIPSVLTTAWTCCKYHVKQAGSRARTPRRGGATAAAEGPAGFPTRVHPQVPMFPTLVRLRVPKFLTHGPPRAPQFPTRARRRVPQSPTPAHHPREFLPLEAFLPQQPFLIRGRRRPRLTRPRRRRRKPAEEVEVGPAADKVRKSMPSWATPVDQLLGETIYLSPFSLCAKRAVADPALQSVSLAW